MTLNQEFEKAFDEVSRKFPFQGYIREGRVQGLSTIVRELQSHLSDFRGRRLLDIGCGAMLKTALFQEMGFQCYSLDDLSDPWHQREDNRIKIHQFAKDMGIEFHQQQIGEHEVPFDVEFDVVTSFAVIEHLHESPRGLLNTMGRSARAGGLIVGTMPNSVTLRKRLSVLRGRTNYPPVDQFYHSDGVWRGHVREYTLAEMRYIFEENGFDVLSAVTFESLAQHALRPALRAVYVAMGNVVPSLRSNLLVVARKPEGWKPAEYDADLFRKVTAKSLPQGIS